MWINDIAFKNNKINFQIGNFNNEWRIYSSLLPGINGDVFFKTNGEVDIEQIQEEAEKVIIRELKGIIHSGLFWPM